jgi:flagellar assembly protein FliH
MSSSPFVPREKLSAYQRWELHSFESLGEDTADRRHGNDRRQPPAPDRAKELQDQAYQTGLAEGVRRGAKQAAGEIQRLKGLVAGLQRAQVQNEQQVAGEVLALALELARQMTRRVLKVRPEVIVPVVQDALARAVQPALQASIIVHPDDAVLLREHLGEQLAAGGWSVTEDPQVARGGCTLQSAANQIDASTATRWRQLIAGLGQTGEWLD